MTGPVTNQTNPNGSVAKPSNQIAPIQNGQSRLTDTSLQLKTLAHGSWNVNVLDFSSPIYDTFVSAQTKTKTVWFPIKTNQPSIQFDVQFVNEIDYENFQNFVRISQIMALSAQPTAPYAITLYWPARSIDNWSGYITQFLAGGRKANPAPRARFSVDLIKSMITDLTTLTSMAPDFMSLMPQQIPPARLDNEFELPSGTLEMTEPALQPGVIPSLQQGWGLP